MTTEAKITEYANDIISIAANPSSPTEDYHRAKDLCQIVRLGGESETIDEVDESLAVEMDAAMDKIIERYNCR